MQTILIIDDDRDICLLLKRFLTRHNYEVLESYSGKKALELLEETEPNLVMCDFRLEGHGRQHASWKNKREILSSAGDYHDWLQRY